MGFAVKSPTGVVLEVVMGLLATCSHPVEGGMAIVAALGVAVPVLY